MAFEPALIDWQPTEDVGFEPVRNETFPLDPPNREVKPPIGATDIVEINLELHPEAHPEKVFPQVEAARNLRVPFEKQLRGDKVVSIGLHVRHFGRGPLPPNTTISSGELRRAMNDIVWPAIKCAKDVENWWYPPFLNVKWLVISDSLQLKQKAAIEVNESKIVITEFDPWVPPSLLNISQSPPPAPAPSSDPSSDPTTTTTTATPEGSPLSDIPSVQTFQETVTEWLLLSSCNSFIVSTSAFGRTAAMYSMHPLSMYMPRSCDPQTPVRISSFGEESKRQF
ncbi:unnamed protein product [Closterium sp. NIES-54]